MTIDAEAFIRSRLPLAPVPGVTEIVLHMAAPASGLHRLDPATSPYWAYRWAGGLALARHLLDRPAAVAGRRVLDLGAGSGIVGIAAALAGAAEVTAADIDPLAQAAIHLNAAANGVAVTLRAGDPLASDAPDVDLILVGDLFYERDLARRATAYLDRAAAAGIRILVGDPSRAFLPAGRLDIIAEYEVIETGNATIGTTITSGVFDFHKARG